MVLVIGWFMDDVILINVDSCGCFDVLGRNMEGKV